MLVFGAYQGFRRGLVAALYGFAALGAELVVAGSLRDPVAALLAPYLPLPAPALAPLAFLALLGAAGIALGLLGTVAIAAARAILYRIPLLKAADRVLGVVPGIAQYALIAAGLILVAQLFVPASSTLGADLRSSALTPLVDYVTRLVLPQSR